MKQSSIFSFVAKGGLKPETPIVDLFCGVRVVHTTKLNPTVLFCNYRWPYAHVYTSTIYYKPLCLPVQPFDRLVGLVVVPSKPDTK